MSSQLAPENVVGRDRLIAQIWRLLNRYSVVFTAERRIGKTTVMKKMQAEAPDGIIVRYLDLEKIDSPQRFVEILLGQVRELLTKTNRAMGGFKSLMEAVGGTEIGGVVKIPQYNKDRWQPALEKALACVCENHPESTLLFLLDEMPYMLQKIVVREKGEDSSENAALAILDSLRAMRSEHDNLRMVYTGSIGLHHVIDSLRGNEYASQPTNEMETVEIGPLAHADALDLARGLLDEEKVECSSVEDVAAELVTLTDRVPFYIERVVMRLAFAASPVTPKSVQQQVLLHLTDDNDFWEMEHFRTRVPIYYPGNVNTGDRNTLSKAAVVTSMLDVLATCEMAQSIDQVCAAIKASVPVEDRDLVIELLRNLSQDHYLICDDQKRYSFRFPLIKKWWVLARGLSS
ncbi:MAG: ATP-binding protein [Lentisphaeria bacterium]|nr:ATP-binding protein [Lentisphaeria bacterium]